MTILYVIRKHWKKVKRARQTFQVCMKLFTRGVKEGVIQKDINFEIVTLLAKEQVKMIRPTGAFLNHSVSEVFKTILFTFLRGICTEKGLAILDRYAFKQSHDLL